MPVRLATHGRFEVRKEVCLVDFADIALEEVLE